MITYPNYINYDGTTQFHLACMANNVALVRELINLGANVNKQDCNGHTALLLAKNPEIVKLLLVAGANPDLQDRQSGYTPLLATFIWHNKPKFDLLVPVTNLDSKTSYGYTALMLASRLDDLSTIETLINFGVDLYIRNNEGADFYDLLTIPGKETIALKFPEFMIQRELRKDSVSIKSLSRRIL